MQTITPITALAATSTAQLGALARPSLATDGVDVTTWRVGKVSPITYDAATVYIAGDGAATLTGPVEIWGYRSSAWWLLGTLDSGSNVTIVGANKGAARRVDEVGIFSRLAVACASVTGGVNYTYTFEPMAIRND